MEGYEIEAFVELKQAQRELLQTDDPNSLLEKYEKRLERLTEEVKAISMVIDVLNAYIDDKTILP